MSKLYKVGNMAENKSMIPKWHLLASPSLISINNVITQKIWLRFPYFLLAGGIATALHWSTMAVLLYYSVNAVWASAIGASVGALSNYYLQKNYVFFCHKSHKQTAWLYLLSITLSWSLNLLLFGLFYQWAGFYIVYAQLLTTALVCVVNFHAQRRVFL